MGVFMSSFTKEEIKRVAWLARIKISDDEISGYSKDLTEILQVIEQLQEVDTTGVKPVANVTHGPMYLREDEVTEKNNLKEVLSNSKHNEFDCFAVPKVID
jgi:aspartyl-tRNA(Asn)/glutamyl-tRNA(Gln) amidotransferase subunit C